MGRRARSFYPRVPTHLTARGVDDQPIFRSDLDRYELLTLLREATLRVDWQVVAWCLMTVESDHHRERRLAYILENPSGPGW
jgi:REP element-mobilizing transposase RayT